MASTPLSLPFCHYHTLSRAPLPSLVPTLKPPPPRRLRARPPPLCLSLPLPGSTSGDTEHVCHQPQAMHEPGLCAHSAVASRRHSMPVPSPRFSACVDAVAGATAPAPLPWSGAHITWHARLRQWWARIRKHCGASTHEERPAPSNAANQLVSEAQFARVRIGNGHGTRREPNPRHKHGLRV